MQAFPSFPIELSRTSLSVATLKPHSLVPFLGVSESDGRRFRHSRRRGNGSRRRQSRRGEGDRLQRPQEEAP